MERKAEDSAIFRCMYMGEPFDASGSIFKKEWFVYSAAEPAEGYVGKVQIWDTALKGGRRHDYNVCVTGAADRQHRIHILDVFRIKCESPELEKHILSQYAKHKPDLLGIEDKAAGTTSMQKLMREHKLPIKAIKADKNKELRARGVTPFFEHGDIIFKAGAGWVDDLEHELLAFPMGKYDDQVDAIVHLIIELQQSCPRMVETKSNEVGMKNIRTREF